MTEQDLHDYNKWLTEIWSKQHSNIPFMADAPKAYLKYRTKQLTIPVVVKSFICDAEEKGGSRCETQCLGCDGFQRMNKAN